MDHNEKDSKIWNLGEVEKFKRLRVYLIYSYYEELTNF